MTSLLKIPRKTKKHSSKIQRKEIKLTMNEFNQYQIEEIDEPYFDLKWLLNQSEYKLFYSGIDNKILLVLMKFYQKAIKNVKRDC